MKAILGTLFLGMLCSSCSIMNNIIPQERAKHISIRTTAYHPYERDHLKYGKTTAIGTKLHKGIIATDFSVFPVFTQLKIGGMIYQVEDYGSALIKPPNVIPTVDIFVTNKTEMKNWGVKYFNDVEIVQWGSYDQSLRILKDRLKYKHCRVMYNRILEKMKG